MFRPAFFFGILVVAAQAAYALPPYVDLRKWQTPIRGQHGNNCFIYATTAALEAKLKREGYGDLDLSEAFSDYMGALQFLETCRMDGPYRTRDMRIVAATERETSLAVDLQPTVESATPLQRIRIPEEKYFSWIRENNVPDGPAQSTDPWWNNQFQVSAYNLDPIRLPRSALTAPRYFGIKSVTFLSREDARRPAAIEALLAAGKEVIWDTKSAGDMVEGHWHFTTEVDPMAAAHRALIVGYDRRSPTQHVFIVKNSWGPTRLPGMQGFTLVDYKFVENYSEWVSTIDDIVTPGPWPELRVLGRWDFEFADFRGTLDLYHAPGTMAEVFGHNEYRDESGRPLADHRLGTFYLNGDPQQAYRVNGVVTEAMLQIFINFDDPAARWDRLSGWQIEFFDRGDGWRGVALDAARHRFNARMTPVGEKEEAAPASDDDAVRLKELEAKRGY